MNREDLRPPRWPSRLLRWICSEYVLESLQGDIFELYVLRYKRLGKFRARLYFYYDMFSALRPFALKSYRSNSNKLTMYQHYFKVALRSLKNEKVYATIKVGGFAIGVAAFLLISLFVLDELSYDKHYKEVNRIYRVANDFEGEDKWASFPAPAARVIEDNFSGIEKVGRLIPYNGWFDAGDNQWRKAGERKSYYEQGFAYADPQLLEILEIPMVYGSLTEALSAPRSIVISKRKAEKYYPGQDPVGQQIVLNDNGEMPYVIGGVMENFPTKSHIDFDFLITLSELEFWPGEQTNWCCWNYNVYLRLNPKADVQGLEDQLKALSEYVAQYQEQSNAAEAAETRKNHKFILQPVSEIYLPDDLIHDSLDHGSVQIVWLFIAIGVLVLLLACVNFINLSTAKAANRAKEVGIRKVVGSLKQNFIHQFLTESFVVCASAVILGLGLVWLLLPEFNEVAQKSLVIPWFSRWFLPSLLAFIFLVTLLSGLYPAFYLSRFRPIQVIRGNLSLGSKNATLRSVMVIFQFTTSTILIVGALLVYRQLDFILNKDLGYDKEQVMLVQGVDTMDEQRTSFKDQLKKLSGVEHVSLTSYVPITGTRRNQNGFWIEGRRQLEKSMMAQAWRVDQDYIETMGLNLMVGRNFEDRVQDSASIIINQKMARELNLDEPVGARIENFQGVWTVIGVIQDFHFDNMKERIRPLALLPSTNGDVMVVKIRSSDLRGTIASVSEVWDEFMPHQPIRFTFLNESFERMYEALSRTTLVFTAFSILAVLIACLGLFGLSAFIVEQRRKEISIRKVLGATLQHIFGLLTVNFLKMVVVSLILAIPVSFWAMSMWLQDFEYAVPISWEVFAIAGITITVIAIVTVSFESFKAAIVNPSKGLKSE